MLLALKLLVVLGVLSYGVAAVLAGGDNVVLAGFQAPLNHILRGGRFYHTSSSSSTTTTSSSSSSSTNSPYPASHHQPDGSADLLLRRPRTSRKDPSLYRQKPGVHKALTRQRQQPTGATGSFFDYWGDSKLITTVDGLRTKHGEGTFWGDLNHIETRFVYHQLLPRHLLQDAQAHPDALAVEDLARLASMARHAARLYARERSSLPLRLAAGLYDGFRHLSTFGRWSWTGMSYEEVWCKYEGKIKEELRRAGREGEVGRQEMNRMVALRILQKSCETNCGFDRFAQVERAHEILLAAAAREGGRKGGRARWEGMKAEEEAARRRRKRRREEVVSEFSSMSPSALVGKKGGMKDGNEVGKEGEKAKAWSDKKSALLPLLAHFEKLSKSLASLA